MAQAGRDQREPMERLVRLATVLHHAGRVGESADTLVKVAGFEGGADPTSQLAREFRILRGLGWQIENVGGVGEAGRYRMSTVDNRLRVRLTPGQRAALLRAVVLADREDLAERLGLAGFETPRSSAPQPAASSVPQPAAVTASQPAVGEVMDAVRLGQVLRFRYKGTPRVVHPESVRAQNSTWYLGGREDGSDKLKWFVVSRMSEVTADAPGTATVPPASRHSGLHPMTWEVDPPVEVTLRAPADFVPDVIRWLGEPALPLVEERAPASVSKPAMVELTYTVTHRAALRCRLFELGPRVEVVGPDEIRQEILDELAFMAGE